MADTPVKGRHGTYLSIEKPDFARPTVILRSFPQLIDREPTGWQKTFIEKIATREHS